MYALTNNTKKSLILITLFVLLFTPEVFARKGNRKRGGGKKVESKQRTVTKAKSRRGSKKSVTKITKQKVRSASKARASGGSKVRRKSSERRARRSERRNNPPRSAPQREVRAARRDRNVRRETRREVRSNQRRRENRGRKTPGNITRQRPAPAAAPNANRVVKKSRPHKRRSKAPQVIVKSKRKAKVRQNRDVIQPLGGGKRRNKERTVVRKKTVINRGDRQVVRKKKIVTNRNGKQKTRLVKKVRTNDGRKKKIVTTMKSKPHGRREIVKRKVKTKKVTAAGSVIERTRKVKTVRNRRGEVKRRKVVTKVKSKPIHRGERVGRKGRKIKERVIVHENSNGRRHRRRERVEVVGDLRKHHRRHARGHRRSHRRDRIIRKNITINNYDLVSINNRVAYYDHYHHRRRHRYEHVYWDRRGRLCNRIVWPRYRYRVRYGFGRRHYYRHVHPYYHRKYIFVSLGGWWPRYRHVRYYWYGCHPWRWYGYYPVAYEVDGGDTNYYTYNYYYGNDNNDGSYSYSTTSSSYPGQVDHTTFEDVREKLAQEQAVDPENQTLADERFDSGVKLFEEEKYMEAAWEFQQAMALSPDDVILPYAYAQALFANEDYTGSVFVLRQALENVTEEQEGIFYPRGLYASDEILVEQIDKLELKLETDPTNSDLQLLMGYHLLGVGSLEDARPLLESAQMNYYNNAAADTLLQMLDKIEETQAAQETN